MYYMTLSESSLVIMNKLVSSHLFPNIGNKISGKLFGTKKLEKQFEESVKGVQETALRVEEKLANAEAFNDKLKDPQFIDLLCTKEFDQSLLKK